MPYSHTSSGRKGGDSGRFHRHSPFEVPVEVVQGGLLWLLLDPVFYPLKAVLLDDFPSVDELRVELVSGNIPLPSSAVDRVLDEIDRLVDDYRKGIAF